MHEESILSGMPFQFLQNLSAPQLPTLAEWNQKYIEFVLSFTKGKKTAAARILGINRRTLYRRKKVEQNEPMANVASQMPAPHMMPTLTMDGPSPSTPIA